MQKLQNEARALERPESADALLGKVGDDGGFTGGDGDDYVIHHDDAKRHGGVAVAVALSLHIGNVHDDEGLVAVALDAGAFLLVQRGLDIGRVQRKTGVDAVDLLAGGVLQVDPASLFKGVDFV
mgnify:FL=1